MTWKQTRAQRWAAEVRGALAVEEEAAKLAKIRAKQRIERAQTGWRATVDGANQFGQRLRKIAP